MALKDGWVPTIAENASLWVTAHDLPSSNPSLDPASSCSCSHFAILGSLTLGHLGNVASNYDIVFHGEKGSRLEHILAICVKERLDGVLAEARARVEPWAEDNTIPFAPELRGPLGNPPSEDSWHREPKVDARLCDLGLSRAVREGPRVGRVPRGRPPTRLHPTEQRVHAHAASVGLP
ncbi:hypothetical protein D1007_20633 [Hordeum vulgare]|nr:hypothetical protein D1007_20633 [Hordeum vulgare]